MRWTGIFGLPSSPDKFFSNSLREVGLVRQTKTVTGNPLHIQERQLACALNDGVYFQQLWLAFDRNVQALVINLLVRHT